MTLFHSNRFIVNCLLATSIVSGGLLVACASADAATPTYKDPTAPIEDRVDDLLSRMTLDEKIGQLNQRSYWGGPEGMTFFTNEVAAGNMGSVLNLINPAEVDSLQRVAVEKSRLGIPLLVSRDVIHGYKTIFPIPLGQAATFDPALVEKGARIAAIEASADGIRWTFAPMIDIARDPRWGRIAESCGEDVYLTSQIGSAMVRGFQSDSIGDPTAVAACAKHFVGYGAAEGGRDYNSTYIPERQLRNVYLVPFEKACEAGTLTYMSSFNDNDGVPATGNRHVLTDILRGEWGFKGFVVSDWGSVDEMIPHGFAADRKDAARLAFNAGVDMEMESGTYLQNLKTLIDEGKVDKSAIDNSVKSILRVKFILGLFDNPYITTPQSVKYAPEHLEAARQAVLESVVMLKNADDILPLDASETKTILVTGPMADAPHDQLGTWTFDGEKDHTITLLDALRQQYGDRVNIVYEPALTHSRDKSTAGFGRAVAAARSVDAVIVALGEEQILSGEAHSLADIDLVGAQNELVEALKAAGKPIVAVVMAGRPLTIGRLVDNSEAVLFSFHPGTMGGCAIADLIFGAESPSGKTPVTFPAMVGQIPAHYSHNMTGRPASGHETLIDDIPLEAGQTSLGCTSYYLDAGFGPLFPFGYGLSYGKFDYSDLTLDKDAYKVDDTITAAVTLTNTGRREATEVVQLYVRDMVGSVTRPVKELKSFRRVALKPGESARVEFKLPVAELAFHGIDMERRVEPGRFTLWIGGDSASGPEAGFSVE